MISHRHRRLYVKVAERFAVLVALGAAGLAAFVLAGVASGALGPRELAAARKRR